jgi:pyruvate carboxylase
LPYLFVYGTLRRGCDNEYARLLAERGEFVATANVTGRLYDFGLYPGARPANDSVTGEIFQIDESLLANLDEYEGSEYERAAVSAKLDDGRTIECWIYWYVGSDTGRVIASGDWLKR